MGFGEGDAEVFSWRKKLGGVGGRSEGNMGVDELGGGSTGTHMIQMSQ